MVPRDFLGPQVTHPQRFGVTYSIDAGVALPALAGARQAVDPRAMHWNRDLVPPRMVPLDLPGLQIADPQRSGVRIDGGRDITCVR